MSDKPDKGGAHGGGGAHGAHEEAKGHKKAHGRRHGGHEEHEEGVPEWVVSFADNALLQMGFFVILLALNMGPKAKSETAGEGDQSGGPSSDVLDFAIAVRAAFNNPVDMTSTRPEDQQLIKRLMNKSAGKSTEPGPAGDKQDVQSIRPGDYYRVGGVVHFDDDSSDIRPMARVDAANIAEAMRGRNTVIEVRGYASAPEAWPDVARGMDLSHERAMAVAAVLVENGVKWKQLRIVACGDNDRVRAMADERSQDRTNQRVEVIATEDVVQADPYSKEPAAAADE